MIKAANAQPSDAKAKGTPDSTPKAQQAKAKDEEDFIAIAMARFKLAAEAEQAERAAALDDLRFLVGEQWDENIKRDRGDRPCLTINKLAPAVSQVVNEQRSQRPAMQVNPVGNGASIDTAKILSGILRHIESHESEIAYDTGTEQVAATGKGYWEVCTDYIPGDQSFNQEIYIKRIKNRFTVYCDPSSTDPSEADADWKFQIEDVPILKYKQKFPNSKMASLKSFKSVGDSCPGWATNQTIRIARYWVKEQAEKTLLQFPDGTTFFEDDVDGASKEFNIKPSAKRKYVAHQVKCYLINAIEVLEETDWPGRVGYIPLVPILGTDWDVNGQRKTFGLVRMSKDAQRMFNYWRSAATESIAMSPKIPWVGWEGQFKDDKWKTANVRNYAYLEASPTIVGGAPAPSLPQRQAVEPPIQAIMAMNAAADMDIKSTTGIYEPSLGQQKIDQSGKAIDLLQRQGQLTNFNYTDNLSRAIRHTGRIILDIIPFIYDAPRVQRIIDGDGSVSQVVVHSGQKTAAQELANPSNIKAFDLSVGLYDVTISVGPSYQTRRQQTEAAMLSLVEAFPQLMQIGGDILVSNMDWDGAEELAARIKKTINPNLLDSPSDNSDPKTIAAKMLSENQKLREQNIQLMQQNQTLAANSFADSLKNQTAIKVAEIRAAAQVEAAGLAAKDSQADRDFEAFQTAHATATQQASNAVASANPQTENNNGSGNDSEQGNESNQAGGGGNP